MVQSRRLQTPGAAAGVTDKTINDLVLNFYAHVRLDVTLGPIFESVVLDWAEYEVKLCAFWSSVLLMTVTYKGSPIKLHIQLPGLSRRHFELWPNVFGQTARDKCSTISAELFIDRAGKIARSLEHANSLDHGSSKSLGGVPFTIGTISKE